MTTSRPIQNGYALLSVIGVVTALLIAGAATIGLVRSQLHASADQITAETAYYVAEAGVQRGLAQLDNDAAIAASPVYVYPTIPTTPFGGGTYTVTLADDPLFPGDSSRKLITSRAVLNRMPATLVAHALVQGPGGGPQYQGNCGQVNPCSGLVMCSSGGNARIATTVSAVTNLFDGDIHTNHDAHFITGLSAPVLAAGNVYTVGNFFSDWPLVSFAAPRLSVNLYRGGNYVNLVDNPSHTFGFHFANPPFPGHGHGTGPVPKTVSLPVPDWDSAKRSRRTILVNEDNYATVAPGSTWSNGTWTINDFELADNKRYYVEGNVNVDGGHVLRLGGGSFSEIWSRGVIGIETLSLASAGNVQGLVLVAENAAAIGRPVDLTVSGGALATAPNLSVSSDTTISTGISVGLTGGGLLNRTLIYAYSLRGEVWANDATVNALSDLRMCMLGAGGDTTLATTAPILSEVKPIF